MLWPMRAAVSGNDSINSAARDWTAKASTS